MGTRASWGFRKNNIEKTTYVQSDGYPTGIGNDIITLIKVHEDKLDSYFEKINMTDNYHDYAEPMDFCKKISKLKYINLYSHDYNHIYTDWGYVYDLNVKELEIYNWGKLIDKINLNNLDYFDDDY